MRARTDQALHRRQAEEHLLVQGRATAADLAAAWPDWHLIYGPASRRLWAYPAWEGAPAGLLLDDTDPRRLQLAMRQAELAYGRVPPSSILRGAAGASSVPLHPSGRAEDDTLTTRHAHRDEHGRIAGNQTR